MENISNMEYSLITILYLVELQIKEGLQPNRIHLIECYPFCDGVNYKTSVSDYLVRYNNDPLRTILNKHYDLCNTILNKWYAELIPAEKQYTLPLFQSQTSEEFKQAFDLKQEKEYDIYCILKKNVSFPFEDIELVKEKNGNGYEFGNIYREDNRYWCDNGCHISFFLKRYSNNEKLKSSFMLLLIEFVMGVREFLSNYVTGTANTPTWQIQSQPHFTRQFTDTEQQKLYNGLINDRFLPKETDYSHFCYAFGGKAIPEDKKPFKPLRWIKTNSTTKDASPNKRSLLELLVLLGIPEKEIKDKSLINSIFEIPQGGKFKANNYSDITDRDGNLKEFKSEYHIGLVEIVNKSR